MLNGLTFNSRLKSKESFCRANKPTKFRRPTTGKFEYFLPQMVENGGGGGGGGVWMNLVSGFNSRREVEPR